MAEERRHSLTILDIMVLVAVSAVGGWGAAAYRAGFPLPIIDRPGIPVLPLLWSVPFAAALTWGAVAVPVRTVRARARRISREPGTTLCAAAAAASLGVVARWSLKAWIAPYTDGTLWTYGAGVLFGWASSCGLGVLAGLALLFLQGGFRRREGWIEWLRLVLAAYWLVVFMIFGIL